MATKNQHYVPQVYIKAWETTVYSIREPKKPFSGVYYYKKNDLSIGDGRNKSTILANNHTYTIGYDYAFLMKKCPVLRKEFVGKIQSILKERKVIAKYDMKILSNTKSIVESFPYLEDWDFTDLTGTLVKKKAIINSIKEIRSYCIEDRFSSYMESNWESTLNKFLSSFPTLDGIGEIAYSFPKTECIFDMLNMVALMMCRNPTFDLLGIFTWLENDVLQSVFLQWEDENQSSTAIRELMRGLWLNEIYRGLFGVGKGFVGSFLSSAMDNLGVMIFKVCNKCEGSFVTSDSPVVYHSLAVEAQNCNGIYFPLTPYFLLFLGKRSDGNIGNVVFRTVGNSDIKHINRIILNSSNHSIVSVSKHLGYIL